jgi:hypothetical protein
MKIKVLKTTKAASDELGSSIKEYQVGETIEIFNELAEIFISQGWGVEFKEFVAEETIEEVIEEKGIEESPENKAVESSPEDKGFFKKIKKRITKS